MVASLLSNKPVCTCRQQASRPALRRQQHPTHAASVPVPRSHRLSRRDVVTRAEGEDTDFEKRLGALDQGSTQGKGFGKVRPKKSASEPDTPAAALKRAKKAGGQEGAKYDWSGESVHFESPPHRGDLAVNLAFGATILWLPLSFAAIVRAASVKYRFTDKRMSVITTSPWSTEQLDAAYQEVKDVVAVPRGLGYWGDMVVTLRNDDKMELRALPKHKEMRDYILRRRDELKAGAAGA